MSCLRFRFSMRFKTMEEIRTNLSKEDVLHNMLELVGYLVEQEEEVDEIEVKVKDLNMQFKAWRDEKQREENR
nr:MAG TPA: hypothetical protein [Caudoviricetes sp.]